MCFVLFTVPVFYPKICVVAWSFSQQTVVTFFEAVMRKWQRQENKTFKKVLMLCKTTESFMQWILT